MADAYLILPDDTSNTGKKLDAESLTVSAQTVYRERLQIAGAADTEIARVTDAEPGASDMGVAVRLVPPSTAVPISHSSLGATTDAGVTGDQNGSIVAHLRGINTMLADVWSNVGNYLAVNFTNTTIAVTNAGTFAVQAAQSGTWNITNISGTVSLPTGAATAAKQPALGTAGSASADVITVQGVASMTPVQVSQATASNLNATVVGTGTFLVQAAQSGTWNIGTVTTVSAVTAISNALPSGTNTLGKVQIAGGNGASVFRADSGDGGTSALTNTAQTIKGSTGTLYGLQAYNPNTSIAYIILYDSSSVTVGTTTPVKVVPCPPLELTVIAFAPGKGLAFSTNSIKAAAVTTTGGNTAPGTALEVSFDYE